MTQLLCWRCDVFVGFGAVGVVERPPNRSEEWLRDHCWSCHRDIDEVIRENERCGYVDPRGTEPLAFEQAVEQELNERGKISERQARDRAHHNFLSTKEVGEPAESATERFKSLFSEREPIRTTLVPGDPPPGTKVEYEPTSKALTTFVDKAMFAAEPMPDQGRDRPRVYLLSATPDPLGAVAAFSMMYEGRVIRDLAEITDDERRHYFDECFKTALQTPLEAIDLHFMMEGITRATWDQAVRQRTAVFAGESLRFAVKENLSESVRPGPSITGEARECWDSAVEGLDVTYKWLIANGVPAEDARGLLPLNVLTRGHWKTNLRNLQAEVGKRLCTQAQFEWRLLHADLRRAIREYGLNDQGLPTRYTNCYTATEARTPNDPMLVQRVRPSAWQWQYIADSKMFQPICFQKGACMFKASMDRGCTIRERVDRGEFDQIKPEEWLTDPKAAWVR